MTPSQMCLSPAFLTVVISFDARLLHKNMAGSFASTLNLKVLGYVTIAARIGFENEHALRTVHQFWRIWNCFSLHTFAFTIVADFWLQTWLQTWLHA
jgi:hypothetical protein